MAEHEGGALRDTVKTHLGGSKDLPGNFLLFGLLAEIFMRKNAVNAGMGGSMHAFFPPFGADPNNAIVGASAGTATGAALRRKLAGDGSTGCGPVSRTKSLDSKIRRMAAKVAGSCRASQSSLAAVKLVIDPTPVISARSGRTPGARSTNSVPRASFQSIAGRRGASSAPRRRAAP